jgi:hypothetical protein
MISVFTNWLIFTICVICLMPTKNTGPVAHVVVITTDAVKENVYMELYKIDKDTRLLMGTGDGKTARNFYLIHGNSKTSSELREVLKNINGVRDISIISLSNPVTNSELADFRKLLLQGKMDASGVGDNELLMYLHSTLKGDDMYVLHNDSHNHSNGSSYLKFMLASDILKNYKDDPNTKTTITSKTTRWEGDLEISEVTISTTVSVEPPEPPPPPPVNISKMSDAQIKKWYVKYDNTLKEEDIEIKRTPTEIIITEKRNGSTGSTRYRIN